MLSLKRENAAGLLRKSSQSVCASRNLSFQTMNEGSGELMFWSFYGLLRYWKEIPSKYFGKFLLNEVVGNGAPVSNRLSQDPRGRDVRRFREKRRQRRSSLLRSRASVSNTLAALSKAAGTPRLLCFMNCPSLLA
jgi:hypothetical protein